MSQLKSLSEILQWINLFPLAQMSDIKKLSLSLVQTVDKTFNKIDVGEIHI